MLWTEPTLRKIAKEEAFGVLNSEPGKAALHEQLPKLLREPVAVGLADQFEATRAAEQEKLDQRKAEIIGKFQEEVRVAVVAQNALATRQINQHTSQLGAKIARAVDKLERDLERALRAERAGFLRKIDDLKNEAERRLDAIVDEKLTDLVTAAVRCRLAAEPIFGPQYSNRELARINGISIREVKRRRRAANTP